MKLPEIFLEIRNRYYDIPWWKIVALRNVVIHQYFGVDLEWEIMTKDLPDLKEKSEKYLRNYKLEEAIKRNLRDFGLENRLPTGYVEFLADLKERIRKARVKTVLSANRELILLYLEIGRMNLERQRKEG